jgi:transcriptional repressor NrdR
LEESVSALERELFSRGENEIPASLIGEKVMEALKQIDKVAYIRFASVYRSFHDVESFQAELAALLPE